MNNNDDIFAGLAVPKDLSRPNAHHPKLLKVDVKAIAKAKAQYTRSQILSHQQLMDKLCAELTDVLEHYNIAQLNTIHITLNVYTKPAIEWSIICGEEKIRAVGRYITK